MVGILRRHGYPPPQVNFLGKAATFNLMYAFPLLLLSDGSGWIASLAAVFGWAFAGWGYNPVLVGRCSLCGAGPPSGRVRTCAAD